jgi:2',3'-cyclic-nucleotide 2'-phosphodiesterase (5'-nucleotidase family)
MVVTFDMTPAQIRSLVAYSYVAADAFEASGVQATVAQDGSGAIAAAGIVLKDAGGTPLDEAKTYKVGMNDYIASSFSFDGKGSGVSKGVTSADTLIDYIKQKGTIGAYPNASRVSLIIAAGSGIGNTPVPLSVGSNVYLDFSSAGNLMTDAMRDSAKADIAFYPCGSMVAGMSIDAGVIGDNALKSLFKAYIGQNKIVYGSMRGSDIKAFLLARSKAYNDIDVQVSGMRYTMNGVSGKNVSSVDCYLEDGTTPLGDTASYIVAFDDYTYNNTYSSAISSQVTGLTSSTGLEQDILIAYVKAHDPLPSSIGTNRITTN